jgi:septin family protein
MSIAWIQWELDSTNRIFSPFSRLKSIDLVCMKKLDTKVNIIPIIAKADTISKTELQKFKVRVRN